MKNLSYSAKAEPAIVHPASPSERMIVALDVSSIEAAREIVDALGETANFYKIGYQLAFAGGLELARQLKSEGKRVFLDMKLLDIDNTIARGVESVAALGVDMLTVHAYPNAMRAAVAAARQTPLCLLGVTVLTSMDDGDLAEAGYSANAHDLVLARVGDALTAGMGGVVASAQEAEAIRAAIGREMALVTPGIRPAGSEAADQKRIMTPERAIRAGASHLVIGRPIVGAKDRKAAASAIVEEIEQAAG